MDFTAYQPAAGVLEKIKEFNVVAVVGPTAVGKTTLTVATSMAHRQLAMVLAQTSRLPRPRELDGIDYHFRPRQEMLERIARHEYVQVAPNLLGELYATAPEDYPATGVGLLAVIADAIPMFQALPFKSFKIIFVVPPSWEEWQVRLRAHGFDPTQLVKRLDEAKRSLTFALSAPNIWFVINDAFDLAAADFVALAQGDTVGPRLQADQERAKTIAQTLLAKL